MSHSDTWLKGDLVIYQGLLCEVEDAGIGKPRAEMRLRSIKDSRVKFSHIAEEHIRRAQIIDGCWVRIVSSQSIYRVRRNCEGELSFDMYWSGVRPGGCCWPGQAADSVRVRHPEGRDEPDCSPITMVSSERKTAQLISSPTKSKINWIQQGDKIFGRCGTTLLRINQIVDGNVYLDIMRQGWQSITFIEGKADTRQSEQVRELIAFAEGLFSFEPGEIER